MTVAVRHFGHQPSTEAHQADNISAVCPADVAVRHLANHNHARTASTILRLNSNTCGRLAAPAAGGRGQTAARAPTAAAQTPRGSVVRCRSADPPPHRVDPAPPPLPTSEIAATPQLSAVISRLVLPNKPKPKSIYSHRKILVLIVLDEAKAAVRLSQKCSLQIAVQVCDSSRPLDQSSRHDQPAMR